MPFLMKLKCDGGHEQQIKFGEGFDRETVEGMGGLMDGSSEMFIYDPREDDTSDIGKCGICRAQVKATVEEVPAS